jgi:hypothetical protein
MFFFDFTKRSRLTSFFWFSIICFNVSLNRFQLSIFSRCLFLWFSFSRFSFSRFSFSRFSFSRFSFSWRCYFSRWCSERCYFFKWCSEWCHFFKRCYFLDNSLFRSQAELTRWIIFFTLESTFSLCITLIFISSRSNVKDILFVKVSNVYFLSFFALNERCKFIKLVTMFLIILENYEKKIVECDL